MKRLAIAKFRHNFSSHPRHRTSKTEIMMETSSMPTASTMSPKRVSPFSATMIGLTESTHRNVKAKEVFEQEAAVISEYLRGVHHSRKISHQQVNYSETVGKLGKIQSTVPVYLERRDEHNVNTTQGFGNTATGYKLKEFNDAMSKVIVEEKGMNDRKRLYNREVGRKAVVNKIIDGTAPNPKPFLFPQKATHTQILALTGTLKAPDARNLPPKVERGKKWLGDGVGWDS